MPLEPGVKLGRHTLASAIGHSRIGDVYAEGARTLTTFGGETSRE